MNCSPGVSKTLWHTMIAMETTQTQHFRGNKGKGFSWLEKTARTLSPKDSLLVCEDSPLDFFPLVIFPVVWIVCALTACKSIPTQIQSRFFCIKKQQSTSKLHLWWHTGSGDTWRSSTLTTDAKSQIWLIRSQILKTPQWIPMHSHVPASKIERWAGSQFSFHPASK